MVQAESGHFPDHWSGFCLMGADFEDLLVVLVCLLFTVEISKASLAITQVVAVPLCCCKGDECGAKETSKDYVVGGAAKEPCRGRGILVKSRHTWDYNPTRGYPGQDITLSCLMF